VRNVGGSKLGWVNSKTENLAPAAFLVSVDLLRARAGLVDPMSV